MILNRCLIYQIRSLITGRKDSSKLLFSLLDMQEFEFGVSDIIQICIWDEFKQVIEQSDVTL